MGQKWSNTYKMLSWKVLGWFVVVSGFCLFLSFFHVANFEWVLTTGTCCMFSSSSPLLFASFATMGRASNNSAGHPQKSDLDDDIDDMLLCQPSASFDIRRASNNPPSSANQVHPTFPLTKGIQVSCQRIVMNMAMW